MKYLVYTILFNCIVTQVYFSDLPDSTGIYQPIIFEQCFGLDIGDEIGLFDTSGLISADCSDQYSEILVGAGIYNGGQITISGFGSIDYCDFTDGYQLPGWIGGHDIIVKVWDSSDNIEYIADVNFSTGSGEWGDIYSVIDILTVNELSISSEDDYSLNSIYPNPFNSTVTFNLSHYNNTNSLKILIFDSTGKLVENFNKNNLINREKLIWNASNLRSGIYFVNFKYSNNSFTQKITLIK